MASLARLASLANQSLSFMKILDVKMENYKQEFSELLDGANVDNVFEILRENIINVYNEKLLQQ